jgi:hypothetical protein
MTIRHAIFIDGAWWDAGLDDLIALVMVDESGIEIRPYINTEVPHDVVRFTFEEFAAIVELVARVQEKGEATP